MQVAWFGISTIDLSLRFLRVTSANLPCGARPATCGGSGGIPDGRPFVKTHECMTLGSGKQFKPQKAEGSMDEEGPSAPVPADMAEFMRMFFDDRKRMERELAEERRRRDEEVARREMELAEERRRREETERRVGQMEEQIQQLQALLEYGHREPRDRPRGSVDTLRLTKLTESDDIEAYLTIF